MKTIKKVKSVLVVAFVLVSSIAFAQPPGGGQRGGKRDQQQGPPQVPGEEEIAEMVSDLADELSLSGEQGEKILELYQSHFEQVEEKTSGNSRPDREEMEALKTTLEKNVKAELTKDQISAYEAYVEKQSKKRPRKRN
ncbi:MAG: hypothetical protein PF486_07190 [Prolixibacteraceae bacterium]|nr:hypothetical protein [Prolixibacteraceae bacterium]